MTCNDFFFFLMPRFEEQGFKYFLSSPPCRVLVDSVAADLFSVSLPYQVAELSELKWIEDLPLLRVLNLLKNPLQVSKRQK